MSKTSPPVAPQLVKSAGSVHPTSRNPWGAVLFDELVPLTFVAFWNDLSCVTAGACVTPAPLPSPTETEVAATATWLFAAFSCFVVAFAASLAASMFVRRDT